MGYLIHSAILYGVCDILVLVNSFFPFTRCFQNVRIFMQIIEILYFETKGRYYVYISVLLNKFKKSVYITTM